FLLFANFRSKSAIPILISTHINGTTCFIQRCCQLPFLSLQLCNLLRCLDECFCLLPAFFSAFMLRFFLCVSPTLSLFFAFCFVVLSINPPNFCFNIVIVRSCFCICECFFFVSE